MDELLTLLGIAPQHGSRFQIRGDQITVEIAVVSTTVAL
jgi:hypothetical protein